MQLADKIRIIRKARGLSQEGLGYSLSRVSKNGVSRQAVSDWENGKSEPCLENIRDLAEVLGVSFDALLDENIDLDNPEVLNAILTKQTIAKQETRTSDSKITTRSIGCDIKIRKELQLPKSPKKFKFKRTIIAGILLLLAGISGILYIISPIFLVFTGILGFFAFLMFIIALTNEILPSRKHNQVEKIENIIKIGHLGYHELADMNGFYGDIIVDDDYVKLDDYEDTGNRISISIDRINDINLEDGNDKNIVVELSDRGRKMIIQDVMNSQEIVETFAKIKKCLDNFKTKNE